MPISPKLPLKLHERLGDDAMTELLTLFGDLGAETRAEFEVLRSEIAALRHDMRTQFSEVNHEINDLKDQMAEFKVEVNTKIAGVQSELIKWSFLFWISTIAIIEFLIRFPR